MALNISTREHLIKITVIALDGRLDDSEAPALQKLCNDYLENGIIHFVFDLREVTMLDTAGLAVFVSILKRTRIQDGDVRLIFPTAVNALRVLQLTKFDQVFTSIDPSQIVSKGF